jgi:hypothetical protein
MAASEARLKGITLVNARAFTIERFGHEGWTSTLEQLVVADRQDLDNVITVGWYSLALYARLLHGLEAAHGAGDFSLVIRQSRFLAERDLTTIQRMFLRMASPSFAIDRIGEYWRRFYDTGTWQTARLTPTRARATLLDWGIVDHALCRSVVGYMGRFLELVGANNVNVEHPCCRAKGDPRCEFDARWGV